MKENRLRYKEGTSYESKHLTEQIFQFKKSRNSIMLSNLLTRRVQFASKWDSIMNVATVSFSAVYMTMGSWFHTNA